MKNTLSKLTDEQREEISDLKELPDDSIDTTDSPETLDWSTARRGVFTDPCSRSRCVWMPTSSLGSRSMPVTVVAIRPK